MEGQGERIKTELAKLRDRWKNEPKNRDIIEMQAKLLKKALGVYPEADEGGWNAGQEVFKDVT